VSTGTQKPNHYCSVGDGPITEHAVLNASLAVRRYLRLETRHVSPGTPGVDRSSISHRVPLRVGECPGDPVTVGIQCP
jgi:hypothetical protein